MPYTCLPVDWLAIRDCAIAGMSYAEIARKFGMLDDQGKPDTQAIRKRASREEWPTPTAVMNRAAKQLGRARHAQMHARANLGLAERNESPTSQVRSESPLEVVAESAVTFGERSRMAILGGLTPQVIEAMAQPEAFRPKNVKELVQVGAMIHKLSGLDQSGNVAVNLNLWSDPARSNPALSGELYEVQDAQEVESEVVETE